MSGELRIPHELVLRVVRASLPGRAKDLLWLVLDETLGWWRESCRRPLGWWAERLEVKDESQVRRLFKALHAGGWVIYDRGEVRLASQVRVDRFLRPVQAASMVEGCPAGTETLGTKALASDAARRDPVAPNRDPVAPDPKPGGPPGPLLDRGVQQLDQGVRCESAAADRSVRSLPSVNKQVKSSSSSLTSCSRGGGGEDFEGVSGQEAANGQARGVPASDRARGEAVRTPESLALHGLREGKRLEPGLEVVAETVHARDVRPGRGPAAGNGGMQREVRSETEASAEPSCELRNPGPGTRDSGRAGLTKIGAAIPRELRGLLDPGGVVARKGRESEPREARALANAPLARDPVAPDLKAPVAPDPKPETRDSGPSSHGIDVWHRVMETRGLFPQYPVEQVQALEAIFEAAGAEVLARGIREWRRSKKIQYRTLRSFLAFSEHFVGEAARLVAQDRRLFHGG